MTTYSYAVWEKALRVAPDFSPYLEGLSLWLRADVGTYQDAAMTIPAITDGDTVQGWEDQCSRGNNAIHATHGPTLRLGILNNKPILRWDGTALWLAVAAGHTIPTQAPVTVFAIAVSGVPVSGRKRLCSFQSGANVGWAFGQQSNYAQYLLTTFTVNGYNASTPSFGLNQWAIHMARLDTDFDVLFWTNRGDRGSSTHNADAIAGNIDFRIGGSGAGLEHWDGDIAEILIYNTELTVTEAFFVCAYLADKYAITLAPALNAINYQTTPTYDGSGEVVHPDVYYNADGWSGYKFWMAMTPFPDSQSPFENPSILASNDGASWVVPGALVNPIVPAPGGGAVNSDPDILVAPDNTMWVTYREHLIANYDRIYVLSSADGIVWGAPALIINDAATSCLSPSVLWDGAQYVMWSVEHTASPGIVERRTALAMTGPWSAAAVCTISNVVSNNPWHLDVILVDGVYIMLLQDEGSNPEIGGLYFLTSSDGITWAYDVNFRLPPGADIAWDSTKIYRGTLAYRDSGYDIWYSAVKTTAGVDVWHVGRTRYEPQ